jgi:NADH-quinone oxidoreductase subunit L
MPVTCVTLTIGLASGAGVVPLAGFFSKESVVSAADRAAHGDVAATATWVGWLVLLSALATVVVTAAYSVRLLLRTFAGEYRGAAHPHDAPALMTWPLVVLAVPAAALGVVGLSTSWLPAWLGAGAVRAESLAPALVPALVSLALVALGALAVWSVWRRDPAADPAAALGRAEPVLADGFGIDGVYDRFVIRPVNALARAVVRVDDRRVSAAVLGIGTATLGASTRLRRFQNGNPQAYVTGALAGVTLLLVLAAVAVLG